MKKIILSGLTSSVAMLAISFIFSYALGFLFPSVMEEYKNSGIFSPWSDPLMSLMFFSPFIAGFVLAIIWNKIKPVFKNSPVKNGLIFGLFYCLLTISGMIMSYSSFKVSLLMVITWSITNFIQILLGCIIISGMNK